jgi:hypothetical protein
MTGPWLVLLARGRGDAEVDDSPYVARGHGREETFQRNIAGWPQVEAEVARIAGLLALDLASEPRPALRVVVKVRYAPFITETHGVTLAEPSSEAAVIARAAAEALSRFTGRRPVRLLGVRAQFEKGARLGRARLYRPLHADLAEGGVGGQRLARRCHSSAPKAASLAWVEAKASGASSSPCRRTWRSACQSVVVVARTRTMLHGPAGRGRRTTRFRSRRLTCGCSPWSATARASS